MKVYALLAVLALVGGCHCGGPGNEEEQGDSGTDSGTATVTCLSEAQSIALSPAEQTVIVSNGVVPPISLTATATLTTGGTKVVTQSMAWTVTRDDDTPPGSMSEAGIYQPATGSGGRVS